VAAGAVLGLTLVLAFPLRSVVERGVIVPAAYLLWLGRVLYESMPQLLCWVTALIVVLLAAWSALLPGERYVPRRTPGVRITQGPVQSLTGWIERAPRGIYYRWLVAHRLGELAHRMLVQREQGRPRSVFAPLTGPDWEPGPELRSYLEHGLHGSFADYPQRRMLFRPRAPTPLDLDIDAAVEFLEAKSETRYERDE
jgi:hypothetical protein